MVFYAKLAIHATCSIKVRSSSFDKRWNDRLKALLVWLCSDSSDAPVTTTGVSSIRKYQYRSQLSCQGTSIRILCSSLTTAGGGTTIRWDLRECSGNSSILQGHDLVLNARAVFGDPLKKLDRLLNIYTILGPLFSNYDLYCNSVLQQ